MSPGRAIAVASALVASLGAAACDEGGGGDDLAAVALAGGDLTIFDRSSNAFRMPAPNLSDEEARRHLDGDAAFEAAFVTAPAPVHAGLGPGFNHFSCTGCHPRDGRGMAVAGSDTLLSPLLVRVSLAPGAGDAVIAVIDIVQRRFALPVQALLFHREVPQTIKTCPGTSIEKLDILRAVARRRSTLLSGREGLS